MLSATASAAANVPGDLADYRSWTLLTPDALRVPYELVGVAFMIKHRKGRFAESGGWEFAYSPAGDAKASTSRCVACHEAAPTRDYVFGRYAPRKPER